MCIRDRAKIDNMCINGMKIGNSQEPIPKSDSKQSRLTPARMSSDSKLPKTPSKSTDKMPYRDLFSRPLDPVEQTPQAIASITGGGNIATETKTPKQSPSKTVVSPSSLS